MKNNRTFKSLPTYGEIESGLFHKPAALWRIEPYFDGISTAVTTYKVVDQNGTLQYIGDRSQCEYFLQHGC